MLKKSSGNMYPWVTHTWSILAGECPHRCTYCYVRSLQRRFKQTRYSGPLRLVDDDFVPLGHGRTIFVEHMSDLWSAHVPNSIIRRVLWHCRDNPHNTYVFQTKNPARYLDWLTMIPPYSLLGTTLETNRHYEQIMGSAPSPRHRAVAMSRLPRDIKTFVTIEPIHDFDRFPLIQFIDAIRPTFINIGADSKGHNLPEPSANKIRELITYLRLNKIEVRRKTNLSRLLK